MKESWVNLGNAVWVEAHTVADKVSVTVVFLDGGKKHTTLRAIDWVDFKRELRRRGFVLVKRKEGR